LDLAENPVQSLGPAIGKLKRKGEEKRVANGNGNDDDDDDDDSYRRDLEF
jgi:hypothetical protein